MPMRTDDLFLDGLLRPKHSPRRLEKLPAHLRERVFAVVEDLQAVVEFQPHEARLGRQSMSTHLELAPHHPVGRLLQLDHEHPLADGMRRAGRNDVTIAGPDRNLLETRQHPLDVLLLDQSRPFRWGGGMLKAEIDIAIPARR